MQTVSLIVLLLVVNALGQSDFEALLQLKKGIAKDPSGQIIDSWDTKSLSSDGCPRNWFGITCTNGYVTSIMLNDMGLVGNFSFPTIIGLKMLCNVSVSNNQLMGNITDIGSIQSLQFLDLSHNLFHGLIDPQQERALANCAELYIPVVRYELPQAIDALSKGHFGFANYCIADAGKQADACEKGFSGSAKSPLSDRNNLLKSLCGIAVAIINLLAKRLS